MKFLATILLVLSMLAVPLITEADETAELEKKKAVIDANAAALHYEYRVALCIEDIRMIAELSFSQSLETHILFSVYQGVF